MLYFSNPGELDMRLTQLFGVNVKPTDQAIGYFGTGLKYAIAVTLRLGGKIQIYSGQDCYNFETEATSIRDKDFSLVYMTGPIGFQRTPMPFTLELGKAWEPWMAYRELWTNAVDEGGSVDTIFVQPESGQTLIVVDCPALDTAHAARHEFILGSKPIAVVDGVEVHAQSGKTLYYKGLKVYETPKPGCFTYNILDQTALTEDRTLSGWWSVRGKLIRALGNAPAWIRERVLLIGEGAWEWEEDWAQAMLYHGVPEGLESHLTLLAKTQRTKLPASILTMPALRRPPEPKPLDKIQAEMLRRARAMCSALGYPVTAEVIVVESLGVNALGTVLDEKLILSLECFRQGTKRVAGTLLEEHIHATLGLRDGPELQNHLVDLVISLGERIQGSPL